MTNRRGRRARQRKAKWRRLMAKTPAAFRFDRARRLWNCEPLLWPVPLWWQAQAALDVEEPTIKVVDHGLVTEGVATGETYEHDGEIRNMLDIHDTYLRQYTATHRCWDKMLEHWVKVDALLPESLRYDTFRRSLNEFTSRARREARRAARC
jgi:hypothetical protein